MNGFADGDFEGALLGSLEGLVDGGFEGMTGGASFFFLPFLLLEQHVSKFPLPFLSFS